MHTPNKVDVGHQCSSDITHHLGVCISPNEKLRRQGRCCHIASGPPIGIIADCVGADVPVFRDSGGGICVDIHQYDIKRFGKLANGAVVHKK